MQIEGDSSKKLVMYSDIDKLEKHLLELSPADSELIKELAGAVRKLSDARNNSRLDDNDKFKNLSVNDFVQQFKDPFLREAFTAFLISGSRAYALIFQLAIYESGGCPLTHL